VIVAIQTFGDLVNLNPHLHAIVSDGLFASNGWLYVVPDLDLKKLELLFRHKWSDWGRVLQSNILGWTYATRDTTVAGVALVSLWNASSV